MSDYEIIGRILQYCEEIQNTHDYFGNNREFFFNSKTGFVYRNAITMLLLQIGELSKLLTDDFRNCHNNIPWKEIIRMRDFMAHHYWKLEYETVWNTSTEDMSFLRSELESIMSSKFK